MADKKLPRPHQVTLLGAMIMGGSIFVVLLAFDRMGSLGSIEAQESADRLVSEPPLSGLGLSVDDVQSLLRILCVVAGGVAVAAAILGWQVLQRDRTARLALSVLAPVLFVAGLATSGFLSAVVVAAVVMLWVQPARDWFAGIAAPTRADAERRRPTPTPTPTQPAPAAHVPGGAPGGSPGGAPAGVPAPPTYPQPGVPTYGFPQPTSAPDTRPPGVLAAVIATIVGSVAVLLTVGAGVLLVLSDRAAFEDEVAGEIGSNAAYQDIDAATVADIAIGMLVVFAVWAVVAVVLAVLTLRRSNGARIALVVSAICAALASLLGVLIVVPLAITAACVAVAVLLLRREANAWFSRR